MNTQGQEDRPGRGVGPHRQPWPDDPRLDPELLANGDARNVVDQYRYWSVDAITADLDRRRHGFHVATENWVKDINLGSIARTANAFAAAAVHIVGLKRWNRRGAMVTDRYQHVLHHESIDVFCSWATERALPVIGVDNIPEAVPLGSYSLPRDCILLFGQEGPGLSDEAQDCSDVIVGIAQYGSTRSINASAAAAIVMHEWVRQHARQPGTMVD